MNPTLLRLPRSSQMMLRWLFLFLLACGLLPVAQAQCPTGDVRLGSQAAVNAFPRGCTAINGSLEIIPAQGRENVISDLSPLQDLRVVTSDVRFLLNYPRLRTLEGLNNLTTVGGNLFLTDNFIENLSALRSLTSVSALVISSEDNLTNLDGLNNLISVGSCLISGNRNLANLSGLEKVTHLNRLDISRNNGLGDLSALVSLTSVAKEMTIEDNPSLSRCAIEPICKLLAAGTSVLISNNAPGCNSVEEVKADCTPLAFTTQPPSQSVVCPGANVEVTVSASGNGRTYQWYKDGVALSGQRSATLTLTNVQPTDIGVYSLQVSNSVSSIKSTDFVLTFDKPELSLSNNGPLTCTKLSVTLTASTTAIGTYAFAGPDGSFTSNGNTAFVSQPGTYTVTLTTTKGCTATAATTVDQTTALAPPSLQTATGQSSVSVPQYSGSVTLLIAGCSGTAVWTGSNGSSGTSTTISVPTTQTGTFGYSATCQLGICISDPVSATVTVQAEALKLLIDHYDCTTRRLELRTTGGNGQPVEYHIPSVTNGWSTASTYVLDAKQQEKGKAIKIQARQRQSDGSGWNQADLNVTPTCGSARIASAEELPRLQVVVLGNPVVGEQVEVEVSGAEGQPLQVRLVNSQGRLVSSQSRASAEVVERLSLWVGEQWAGLLVLQVSTPTQRQTVKVLKAE